MSQQGEATKAAKRAAAKAAKVFDLIRHGDEGKAQTILARLFWRGGDRARDLEAIANVAAESDPAVEAAIRQAAHEVARMTKHERTPAAIPKPMRDAVPFRLDGEGRPKRQRMGPRAGSPTTFGGGGGGGGVGPRPEAERPRPLTF